MPDLYPFINEGYRAMVFVDGENLAIRYGAAKRQQGSPDKAEVVHIPGSRCLGSYSESTQQLIERDESHTKALLHVCTKG